MGTQSVVFCLGTSVNVRAKSTLYHHHFSTPFYLHLHDHKTSGWRRPSPDRTTTPRAKRASTSKSTWSFTPATSITPWPSILTGMTWLSQASTSTSRRRLTRSVNMQRNVNQALLDLHKLSDGHGDAQMCDFIEANYLTEQVEAIKEISDHVTNLKRVGPGLGEYIYQKESLGE